MKTPFCVRRIISYVPLLVLGVIEWIFDVDFDAISPSIYRFHRWGTWVN